MVSVVVMLDVADAPVAPAAQFPAVSASEGFPLTLRWSEAPVTDDDTSIETGESDTVAVLLD